MIVDLQVNLEAEDGSDTDPETLIQSVKSAGLDGVLLTKEGALGIDVAPYQAAGTDAGVQVFGGVKIASNHGLILCILPEKTELAEDFADQDEGVYDANAVVEAIEEMGGVTVALRPYDRDVTHPMGDHLFSLQGLTACEVQSGQLSDIANDLALEAASNMEMPCIGTSGAQGSKGLGTAATLLHTPVQSTQELCELIRHGACWPVTFHDEVPQGAAAGSGDRGDRDRGRRSPGGGNRNRGRGRGGDGGGGGNRGRGRGGGGRRDDRRDDRSDRGGGGGGNRGRGRGGGGGGGNRGRGRGRGGGKRPDDIGNRAPQRKGPVPEDIGNRIRPDEANQVDDGIGNKLRPGEASPYHRPSGGPPTFDDHDHDHDDDNIGNR